MWIKSVFARHTFAEQHDQDGQQTYAACQTTQQPLWLLAVLEDILWAFMGFEGKYIKIKRGRSLKQGVSYFLEGRVEHAMHELVNRMLPIWYVARQVTVLSMLAVRVMLSRSISC